MNTVTKFLFCMASAVLGILAVDSTNDSCKEPLLSGCFCGEAMYVSKKQFVVNCTNVGFNDTKPLEKLPNNTQILIFTGNNITELPANVFGTQNNSHLHVIDMSNNKIKVIHGKAFHKVSTVERLILNHNELSTVDEHHFRVFSNFENLVELHLTNAFVDNSVNMSSYLHTVFLNSDLVKLRKLHLEQNEIRSFKDDPYLFCSLTNLMDLHLSNNKLEHIRFKLDCLHHLRFLDLEGNNIIYLTKEDLSQLDVFPKRNLNFTIDLNNNPFSCGYQIEFFSWLSETKVEVRNKNKLKCKHDAHNPMEPLLLNAAEQLCHFHVKADNPSPPSSDGTVLFLLLLLLITVGLLIYTNLEPIKSKLLPIFHSLSKKVHYTTIGKNEAHEMEV